MKKFRSNQIDREKMDRVKGALYGFAIGDAMGATTEFMTYNSIKKQYGTVDRIIGGGWLGLKAGQVTDDTEMSIAVMDAIIRAGSGEDFAEAVKDEFIKWYCTMPKDIGNQCSQGIRGLIRGDNEAQYNPDGLGNGSLMRALPCALIDKEDWNIIQGRMTHNNEICDNTILAYHSIVRQYIDCGKEAKGVIEVKKKVEPTGCVINTMKNAVYVSHNAITFANGIVELVNDGGDADTIAAIGGSILGAKFGYDHIPMKWISKLDPDIKIKLENFLDFCCQHYIEIV